MIAAHAIRLGATDVTANEADFRDIPGLSVENWVTRHRADADEAKGTPRR